MFEKLFAFECEMHLECIDKQGIEFFFFYVKWNSYGNSFIKKAELRNKFIELKSMTI